MTDEKWIADLLREAVEGADKNYPPPLAAEVRVAEKLTSTGMPIHPSCRCGPHPPPPPPQIPMICDTCGRTWTRLFPEPKPGEASYCLFCRKMSARRKDA